MAYGDVVAGLRAAGNGLAANQKPDIDSVLKVLKPYQTPLMQYLFFSGLKSKPVFSKSSKFSWFEDEMFPHQTTIAAAITLTGITLVLTAVNTALKKIFNLNDIVYIEETDEQAYVSSITAGSGSDVVLTHMDGSTSLTGLSSVGSYLKVIGSVNSENAALRTSMTTQEVEKYNYCTIFQETISNTGRDQAGQNYTDGLTHAEQVQKKMEEMKLQFERNFVFSKTKGLKTVSNIQTSYGEGMMGRFTTNISTYAGSLTEVALDAHFKKVAAKGTGAKAHYCGSDQHAQITEIVKNKIGSLQGSQIITKYGARITKYVHAQCEVDIIWDPVFDGKFVNWGFTVDKGLMTPRHMANDDKGPRKFRTEANVQTPGADYKATKLLADIGIQIEQEETGGILRQA